MKRGVLFVISAPAGCGKDTILEKLLQDPEIDLVYSVSATTRSSRAGETDGKDYFFKSRGEFEELIQQGAFLEYTEYCGNYYGTLNQTISTALEEGHNIILKIETNGAANVKKIHKDSVLIFILPPSMEELRRRLKFRSTEDDETIERRLEKAKDEIAISHKFDYRVTNCDLLTAVSEVAEIIKQEQINHNG